MNLTVQKKIWLGMIAGVIALYFFVLITFKQSKVPADLDPGFLPWFYFSGLAVFFLSFILPKPLVRVLLKKTDLTRNDLNVCLIQWIFLIIVAILGSVSAISKKELFACYPLLVLSLVGFGISHPSK